MSKKKDQHEPRYESFIICYTGLHPKYTFTTDFWKESTPLCEIFILHDFFNDNYEKNWIVILFLNFTSKKKKRRCLSKLSLKKMIIKHNAMNCGDPLEIQLMTPDASWSEFGQPIIVKSRENRQNAFYFKLLKDWDFKSKKANDENWVRVHDPTECTLASTSVDSRYGPKSRSICLCFEIREPLLIDVAPFWDYFSSQYLFDKLGCCAIYLSFETNQTCISFKTSKKFSEGQFLSLLEKYATWKQISLSSLARSDNIAISFKLYKPTKHLFHNQHMILVPSFGSISYGSYSISNIHSLIFIFQNNTLSSIQSLLDEQCIQNSKLLNIFTTKNVFCFEISNETTGIFIQFSSMAGKRLPMKRIIKAASKKKMIPLDFLKNTTVLSSRDTDFQTHFGMFVEERIKYLDGLSK